MLVRTHTTFPEKFPENVAENVPENVPENAPKRCLVAILFVFHFFPDLHFGAASHELLEHPRRFKESRFGPWVL